MLSLKDWMSLRVQTEAGINSAGGATWPEMCHVITHKACKNTSSPTLKNSCDRKIKSSIHYTIMQSFQQKKKKINTDM